MKDKVSGHSSNITGFSTRSFTGVGHPSVFREFYSYVDSPTKEYITTTKEHVMEVLFFQLATPGRFQAVENTVSPTK